MDQITLLWWLTGIYLAVLVVVLAIATVSVAFYAWRISVKWAQQGGRSWAATG